MTGKGTPPELFVTRLRRRTLTHAFERALEDALDESGGESWAEGAAEADSAAQKFQSVLEAFAEHPEAEGRVATPSFAAAYRYDAGEPKIAATAGTVKATETVKPSKPVKPVKADEPRPDPRRAAVELGVKLNGTASVAEIKSLRRQFALANHPDRVPAELREAAAEAMAVANARIDQALKRARKP